MRANLLGPGQSGPGHSDREHLRADCDNCAGLCCVALAFTRSADFGFDKNAGEACVNLDQDFRCGIHPHLRESGFKGCTVFDCLGAGPRVTAAMGDWRQHDDAGAAMFATFPLVRQLHELLWYLIEATGMPELTRPLHDECERALAATEALARLPATELISDAVAEHRMLVVDVLARVSSVVRGRAAPPGSAGPLPPRIALRVPPRVAPGADLIGANLAGLDLGGANLRGAYLIAADLSRARFDYADLIGADLRDARVQGADLSRAIFLTQPQVNAALGDASTRIPPALLRPNHWL